MIKTQQMELIELRRGADIRSVIVEAFEEAGDIVSASRIVGVSPSTLSTWIKQLDGDIQSRAIFRIPDSELPALDTASAPAREPAAA